jgi:hypothetical protein
MVEEAGVGFTPWGLRTIPTKQLVAPHHGPGSYLSASVAGRRAGDVGAHVLLLELAAAPTAVVAPRGPRRTLLRRMPSSLAAHRLRGVRLWDTRGKGGG